MLLIVYDNGNNNNNELFYFIIIYLFIIIIFFWGGRGVVLYLPAKEKVLAGITMNRIKAWNLYLIDSIDFVKFWTHT